MTGGFLRLRKAELGSGVEVRLPEEGDAEIMFQVLFEAARDARDEVDAAAFETAIAILRQLDAGPAQRAEHDLGSL